MEFENDIDKMDQHFLIDEKVITKFIESANLNENDVVVEVGPGKGNISALIAQRVKKLYLIELDTKLSKFLIPCAKKSKNIEIIFDNVLNTYIPKCDKILTSLPYSIVEPFINRIIKCQFNEILMITGSKYADGVINNKVTKLSLLTNCFFKAEKIIDILPEAFNPKPRVLSSMIRLIPISENELSEVLIVFRNLYFYADKKVKNALVESLIRLNYLKGLTLTQRNAKSILDELSLDEKLLSKKFSEVSNIELEILYKKIEKLFN